jgi:hypothetical protein
MLFHHTPDLKSPRNNAFRSGAWLLVFLLLSVLPSRAALQLVVEPEEPSGVFWAAQTVKTQTELLFSLRVRNDFEQERPVFLSWRIVDANGKTQLKDSDKLTIAARGAVFRRRRIKSPPRGAYALTVAVEARRDGPDDRASVEVPFAVVTTPDAAYRPRSFFGLTTPAILSTDDLQFYKRIGARVLRSDWLPGASTPGGQPLTEPALDAQLQVRAAHSLATQAVLPYQAALGDDLWLRRAQAAAQRYRGIEAWEASGLLPPATLENWAQAMRAARPDAQLYAALPPGPAPSANPQSWTANLPAAGAGQPSAAIMRLLLAQKERAQALGGELRVRRGFDAGDDALAAAGRLVTRYVLAISGGASGLSATLPPPRAPGLWSRQRLSAMAEAAAFAQMATRLEDTSFSREVWSHLPTLWAEVFKTPTQSVAVVWADSGDPDSDNGNGRLKVAWPASGGKSEAHLYDVFGNEIGQSEKGRLSIPLGPSPVYVVSGVAPNEAAQAIGKGELDDVPELAADILPVTRWPEANKAAPLRVRLQNIGIEPVSGALQLAPPRGWELTTDRRQFTLKAGEQAIYEFPVAQASLAADGLYAVKITATFNRRRLQWKQTARTATALNVRAGETMRVDGALDEWSDAAWMQAASADKNGPLKNAQVALKWSADQLFIAAQVREDKLTPRAEAAPEYSFWQSDAIQLAFGMRDAAWMRPARNRFRDTDYGFLLSPFRTLANGAIEARVLRLWSPTLAFGGLPDRVRYGGVAPGARCAVRRDETAGVTFYEASIPLNSLPELQPMARAAGQFNGPPLRFGWIAHNETGAPLQWSQATGVFPWWNNPGSFLPDDALHFAAQSELGFTRRGEVGNAPPEYAPPSTPPTGPTTVQPVAPPVIAPPPSTPPPGTPPPTPAPAPKPAPPEYTPPMPIDLLPPAAPVEGQPLPPSAP